MKALHIFEFYTIVLEVLHIGGVDSYFFGFADVNAEAYFRCFFLFCFIELPNNGVTFLKELQGSI